MFDLNTVWPNNDFFYQKPKYLLLVFDIQIVDIFTELFCEAWHIQ